MFLLLQIRALLKACTLVQNPEKVFKKSHRLAQTHQKTALMEAGVSGAGSRLLRWMQYFAPIWLCWVLFHIF